MVMLDTLIRIFIIYVPILCFILIALTKTDSKYSFYKNSISSLAKLNYPFKKIFNISIGVYGILSFSTIYKFILNYETYLSYAILLFYIFVGLGTIFIGIFPTDKKLRIHKFISIFLFLSLVILEILTSCLFLVNSAFNVISFASALLLILTIILIIRARDMRFEYKYSRFEWLVLFGTFIWNILFSLLILHS